MLNVAKKASIALIWAGLVAYTNQSITTSGFMSNYGELKQSDKDIKVATYRSHAADFKLYNSVITDPVTLVLKVGNDDECVAYSELVKILQTQLNKQFGKHYHLTQKTGPNVLKVRAAITGVTAANPWANAASTVLIAAPFINGGASAEGEIHDSVTGERLAALTLADEVSIWKISHVIQDFTYYGYIEILLGDFARSLLELTQKDNP